MKKLVFEDYYDEDGDVAEIEIGVIFEAFKDEHWKEATDLIGCMQEAEVIEYNSKVTNEDFNGKLDALKTVFYRLSGEEEDMLNNLFKKYL